jgi:hypothetical protein
MKRHGQRFIEFILRPFTRRFLKAGLQKCVRRLLEFVGRRPIILLDNHVYALYFLNIDYNRVIIEGLKRGVPIIFHRVWPTLDGAQGDGLVEDLYQCYRGVRLFDAVEYSLCISLEIARHEFNPANDKHVAEARRWLAYAKAVVDEMISLFERKRPRAVVFMQGYYVEAVVARQLASTYGVQLLAMERTFHTERIICEPVSGISVNKNSAMAWFHRFQGEAGGAKEAPREIMARIDSEKHAGHASPQTEYQWPAARRRILFLGQCFTDSSVLFGVHGAYSTVEIVRELVHYAVASGSHLFIKLHPKEKCGGTTFKTPYNKLTRRRLDQAGFPFGVQPGECAAVYHLDEDNEFSTQALMKTADVVVTINSQGGFEAQAFGREVVLCGEAFYDRLGTTWNVPHPVLLAPTLDAIMVAGLRKANMDLYSAFMHIYFERYCIGQNPKDLTDGLIKRSRRIG